MAQSFQKMVYDHNNNYVQLKVGVGSKIYLDGKEKMKDYKVYKVGSDGYIYSGGNLISKMPVEDFCKSQGFIRGFNLSVKGRGKSTLFVFAFYFQKNIII